MKYYGRINRRAPAGLYAGRAQPRNRRGSPSFVPRAFFLQFRDVFFFWKEVKTHFHKKMTHSRSDEGKLLSAKQRRNTDRCDRLFLTLPQLKSCPFDRVQDKRFSNFCETSLRASRRRMVDTKGESTALNRATRRKMTKIKGDWDRRRFIRLTI